MNEIQVSLSVDEVGALALALDRDEPLSIALGDTYIDGGAAEYDGPYEVTPSSETQVLQTQFLKMAQNVIVNPIPSNYGLVTWNGAVLTVS